eukprot:GHVT01033465.1.p2 GENE.GHVT01033465.1~~GHVT01033465.1.p2  ORF type:complete len:118 (+),score=12.67 GHVT01033465.1:984-1337(+)
MGREPLRILKRSGRMLTTPSLKLVATKQLLHYRFLSNITIPLAKKICYFKFTNKNKIKKSAAAGRGGVLQLLVVALALVLLGISVYCCKSLVVGAAVAIGTPAACSEAIAALENSSE